jgi:polyhydroxybutyrate depolymerase
MSLAAIDRFAAVVREVEEHWCIDPAQVYASGHSDGGTVATALAILPKYSGLLRGIAVSGAGWEKADFDSVGCVAPRPILIMHGADDGHFPGFGRDAAVFWSACNRCQDSGKPQTPSHGICYAFTGCAAPTTYCEPKRSHWRWAGDPPEIVGFLARQAAGGAPSTQVLELSR